MARVKNRFLANLFQSNENFDDGLTDIDHVQPIEGINTQDEAQQRIDELKAENELSEIEASIEQDMALIDDAGNTVEELADATEEIGELRESMEAAIERGGFTTHQARIAQLRLANIDKRLNLSGNDSLASKVSVEAFDSGFNSRIQSTISLEEEAKSFGQRIKDFIIKMWENLKKFFRDLKDKVMSLFDLTRKNIDKTIDKVKTAGDKGIDIRTEDAVKIVGSDALKNDAPFDKVFTQQINGTRFWVEFFKATAEKVNVEQFDADDFAKFVEQNKTASENHIALGGNSFEIVIKDDGYDLTSRIGDTKDLDVETPIHMTTADIITLFNELKSFYDKCDSEFKTIHKIIDLNADKVKRSLENAEANNDQEQIKSIRLLTNISSRFMSHGLAGTVKFVNRAINHACKVFQTASA